MDIISKDDAFEIADSTDWLETPLHPLAAVDSALRCQVCKDFYNTPMITSCSHTFCSLCIRRCLNNDGKCPACRAMDQEMRLRNNAAMEDLVEAFKRARPDILGYARKQVSEQEESPPKRKREQAELDEEDDSSRKRTRSSARRKPPQERYVIADSGAEDEDYIPEKGYVLCPICEKEVREESINAHIDRGCKDEPKAITSRGGRPGRSQPNSSMSDKPTKRPDRLPPLHYSTLKDAVLKKKLTEMGLSASGNRQMLEKRYTEWITLWNANCDATKPKTKTELKRELDIWERTLGGRAQVAISQPGAKVKDKDFDKQAWSNTHNDDFLQLIANARKNIKPVTTESTTPNLADNSTASMQNKDSPSLPRVETGDASISIALSTGSPGLRTPDKGTADSGWAENGLPQDQEAQRRFCEDTNVDEFEPPPSSQYASKLAVPDHDSNIPSAVSSIRPLQSSN